MSTVCIPVRERVRPGITWADIMADRVARGLEVAKAKAPAVKRVKAAAGPCMVTTADGEVVDQRDPRNTAQCTARIYSGPAPKSAAGAAKARRELMSACGCRRCALAMWPPLTFAEHRAFCGVILDSEQEAAVFGGPRVKREHCDNRDRIEREKSADARAAEFTIHGPGGITG